MIFSRKFLLITTAICVVHVMAQRTMAQFDNFWTPASSTPSNWNDDSNWSEGGVPDIGYQEIAVINNGGSAYIQNTVSDVGGITLGRVAGGSGNNSGALEIRANGNVTALSGVNNNGAVIVGQDATGTLTVLNGGQLTAASLQSNGAGSSITLNGNGRITTTGAANLNSVTNIVGQAATVNVGQGLVFGGGSRLQIDIAGASAPLIKAGQAVGLGGTLEVDFGGLTPAPGTSWNLFDAGGVVNQFSQVQVVGGSLGLGQRLRVRSAPSESSTNGVFGQLVLEQLLVLEVNRDSGAMTIRNPLASTPISIDSYAITSANGSFNTANGAWTSLNDQSLPGWIEANPQPTQLAELKTTTGQMTINGGQQLSLGTPWNPQFTQLGQNLENVVFRYAGANGELITAPVIYTGAKVNDIALFVDPATGAAQLRNGSNFLVNIEGYSIRSASMSLDPAGWSSLDDNNITDWLEANPNDGALSEFKTEGVEALSANRAFDLGQLFDVGGTQDLVFSYLVAGQSQPTLGRVLYQELPSISPGIEGDFDGDGDVDGRDFLKWQRGQSPNALSASDLATWKANYGQGASLTASLGAVPEPHTMGLVCIALLVGTSTGGRRRCGA